MRDSLSSTSRRLAACVLAACCLTVSGRSSSAQEDELVFGGSVLRTVRREVSIVEAAPAAALRRKNPARDASGRFEAFTVEQPSPRAQGFTDRIYFTDRRTRRTFEIRGLPNPHRPLDGLVFRGRGILQFDRWASPHYGVRYRLDARRRRLVSAQSFADTEYVGPREKSPRRR